MSCLKDLQNCNRKLFLCPPQKWAKTQAAFWAAIFHDKRKLWLIKLSKYRKINLLLLNCTDLVFSSLEIQRRLLQTKVYHKFFTLAEKKQLTNLQKYWKFLYKWLFLKIDFFSETGWLIQVLLHLLLPRLCPVLKIFWWK